MSSLHGDFILQRSMPAPALESAQAGSARSSGLNDETGRQRRVGGRREGGGDRVIHWQQEAVPVTRD